MRIHKLLFTFLYKNVINYVLHRRKLSELGGFMLFFSVSCILFDLDNTLYRASSPLLGHINERINRYIADYLHVSMEEAKTMRKTGFEAYGTTMQWLCLKHGLTDTEHYLAYIHPPYAPELIMAEEHLRETLDSMDVRKFILTNATEEHARRITDFLGITDCFEHIFDLRFNRLVSKPDPRAYLRAVEIIGMDIREVLFADDQPRFLPPFQELGGQVVLMDHLDRHAHEPFARVSSCQELARMLHEKSRPEK